MHKNKIIRLNILKERWGLQPSVKTHYDHQIYLKVLQKISTWSKQKYIAFYWPMENEVDTIALIHTLLEKQYKLCLPCIHKDKIIFKSITSVHFEYEYWKNMRQPVSAPTVKGNEIGLMIIPLIGFNTAKYRLGYGFNHYNNYLHYYGKIHTIGLAYSFQKNDDFVTNNYDKVLDLIITN